MKSLQNAYAYKSSGCFRESLQALEGAQIARDERITADVLRAELQAEVGQYERAAAGAASLLRNAQTTGSQRATCEQVLGLVLLEAGDVDAGLAHFQRAASAAHQAGDLERLFTIQLNVMAVL